jgi:outer membrane protein OmpA-like peptidoglycan-associated protein
MHAGAGPATRRPTGGGGGGAAASCGLRDTSNDRGVNLCVTFGLNSAVLTPQSRSSLNRLVEALSSPDIRGHTIRIEGYADLSGNAQANQKLSEARAESVAAYLVQHGVSRDHVESQGYGATHLLPDRASTDPANRRVEARLKN